jgi:catechol 2,3-dioxygenase-like lactoylglutathione lyase family enzyme
MALTVKDMRVSTDWYRRVLGFEFVKGIFGSHLVLLGSPGSS